MLSTYKINFASMCACVLSVGVENNVTSTKKKKTPKQENHPKVKFVPLDIGFTDFNFLHLFLYFLKQLYIILLL